jgi:polyhydroxyalkanoate synthase
MPKEWNGVLEFAPEKYQEMYQRVYRATQVLTTDAEPEVAPTPKEVVWTRNKTKLYRYISDQPKKHKTPLLLVYALINKPYIGSNKRWQFNRIFS